MTTCKTPCPSIFSIPEIAFEVAKHLDTADLAAVVRVSKRFFDLFTPSLWRTIAIERGVNHTISLATFQAALARYGHHHVTTLWINTTEDWLVESGLSQYCRRLDDLTLALDFAGWCERAEEQEEAEEEEEEEEEDMIEEGVVDDGERSDSDGARDGFLSDDAHMDGHPMQGPARRNETMKRRRRRRRRTSAAIDQLLRNNRGVLSYLSLSCSRLPLVASSFTGMLQLRCLHLTFADLTVRDFFKIVEDAPLLEELSCQYNVFQHDDDADDDAEKDGGGLVLGDFNPEIGFASQDPSRADTLSMSSTSTRATMRRLQFLTFALDDLPRDILVLCQLLYKCPQLTELNLVLTGTSGTEMLCYTLEHTCPQLQSLFLTGCFVDPSVDVGARWTTACRDKPLKSLQISSFTPWSPHSMRFDYLSAHLEQLQLWGVCDMEEQGNQHDDEDGVVEQPNEENMFYADAAMDQHHPSRLWIRTLLQSCTRLKSLHIYAERKKTTKSILEGMVAVKEWHCQRIEELALVFPPVDRGQDRPHHQAHDGAIMLEQQQQQPDEEEEEQERDDYSQHHQQQQPTPPPSISARERESVELRFIRKVRTSLPRLRHLCLQGYDSGHPGLRLRQLLRELYPLRGSLVILSIPRHRHLCNEANEGLRRWLDEHWPELTIQGLKFFGRSPSPPSSSSSSTDGDTIMEEQGNTVCRRDGGDGGEQPQALPPRLGEDVPPSRCWGVDWREDEYR